MPIEVVQGTCGWQDQEYPATVKRNSEHRLQYFSRRWPCVEVNSSTYQIPTPQTTSAWAKSVPPGFLFHFKAFGLFCSRGSAVSNLPGRIKDMLPPGRWATQTYISLADMPADAVNEAWAMFHAALNPVYDVGKLGAVTFQFHLSFQPSENTLSYVLQCRKRLDSRFRMAVEFRCRRWFTEEPWRQKTAEALTGQGISWVAADELEHETMQKDREQNGLLPGQQKKVLPIALEITTPEFFYIRVHRRHGGEERRLDEREIAAWAARIEHLADSGNLKGPVYVLWGTEHKKVPWENAEELRKMLRTEKAQALEWSPKAAPGTIAALFSGAATTKRIVNSAGGKKREAPIDHGGGGAGGTGAAEQCKKKKTTPETGIKRFLSQV